MQYTPPAKVQPTPSAKVQPSPPAKVQTSLPADEGPNHNIPIWKLTDNIQYNKPAIEVTVHNNDENPNHKANIDEKENIKNRNRIWKNRGLTITFINVGEIKGKIKSLEFLLHTEEIDIALTISRDTDG